MTYNYMGQSKDKHRIITVCLLSPPLKGDKETQFLILVLIHLVVILILNYLGGGRIPHSVLPTQLVFRAKMAAR